MPPETASVDESKPAGSRPAPRFAWASMAWAVIACGLLAGSGVVRTVQARRHQADADYREACPFPLAQIPDKLGDWKLIKGTDRPLDALTMRITGGTDHIARTYSNELTGVSMVVLVLFGPAEPVLPHVPAICYPASGFSTGDAVGLRTIDFPMGRDEQGKPTTGQAQFLAASYFKAAGRLTLREAVYHSFRLDGEWSPFVGSGKKFPRRNPGVFKVQIQRQVAEGEYIGAGDPIEQFLASLLPELETRIKAAGQVAAPAKPTLAAR